MRGMHLSAIDLNLLPLLDALLSERHVTRAARRVGLSQPAASRALARLRELLNDPLLVRKGRSLGLSPRAEALQEPLRSALGLVSLAIAPAPRFDPRVARRRLRIASDDYSGFIMLTPLVERLARAAPGIDLHVLPSAGQGLEQLVKGDVDLCFAPIGMLHEGGPGVVPEALGEDRFVCMVGKQHPFARRAPNLTRFLEARHALIAPGGSLGGVVDQALAARGLERRVALALPSFLTMPFAIAGTDLVLTLAERVARPFGRFLPVAFFAPPLALPGFTTGFFWHQRDESDPAIGWLRSEILALRPLLERAKPALANPRRARRAASRSG